MSYTRQNCLTWEQGPVTIRALRSLTPTAFDAVSQAIHDLPGGWALERHEDYDGYLSFMISPENNADMLTYLVSGRLGQIELAQFKGDELHTLGRFEHIEATVAELVKALTQSPAAN